MNQPSDITVEAAVANTRAEDPTLANIRELLYGEDRRTLFDEIAHLRDRQKDFEEWTQSELRRLTEELRTAERAQNSARKTALGDISQAVETMAHSIAKLADK